MSQPPAPAAPVLLWQGTAPGARGEGTEDRPALVMVRPPGSSPVPAVVICPGGGYAMRADHEGLPIARWLAGLGIAGLVLSYRVQPYRHPIPLGDAQRAIRMVRHHHRAWGIDPRRVGILGFSAGGHLAASAATINDGGIPDAQDPIDRHSCRPDLAVLCYPVISFNANPHQGSMVNLIGDPPDPDLRDQLSIERRVDATTPPTFLWHTADDPVVPVANVLVYTSAMAAHGRNVALHIFPHGAHGLGLAEQHPQASAWTGLCARWLQECGFAP